MCWSFQRCTTAELWLSVHQHLQTLKICGENRSFRWTDCPSSETWVYIVPKWESRSMSFSDGRGELRAGLRSPCPIWRCSEAVGIVGCVLRGCCRCVSLHWASCAPLASGWVSWQQAVRSHIKHIQHSSLSLPVSHLTVCPPLSPTPSPPPAAFQELLQITSCLHLQRPVIV